MIISDARVLQLKGPVLIFEFEVPASGFLLPAMGEEIRVRLEDGSDCRARIIGDMSSKPGPHQEGLTVRLAVSLAERSTWDGLRALLHWTGRIVSPAGDSEEIQVIVHMTLGGHS